MPLQIKLPHEDMEEKRLYFESSVPDEDRIPAAINIYNVFERGNAYENND